MTPEMKSAYYLNHITGETTKDRKKAGLWAIAGYTVEFWHDKYTPGGIYIPNNTKRKRMICTEEGSHENLV